MQDSAVYVDGDEKAAGGLHRRQFLVLGAVGLAAPLLTQVAAAQERLAVAVQPMSIGYVEGTDLATGFAKGAWRKSVAAATATTYAGRVVPARSLPTGDLELANQTVRLAIHGLYPRVAPLANLESADLDFLFPSPDPASKGGVPFYAWSYRRRPAVSPSPPLSFVVPLGVDGRLDVALRVSALGTQLAGRVARGTLVATQSYKASFTVDPSDDRPKLQRGLYLLGLTPVWDKAVDLPQQGEKPDLNRLSIVLSVEPMSQEEQDRLG